ncbi:MAG: hypothetical protein IPI67_27475 [Myxococcales bacterium]|nr:hypothetical protein [Myxococcales bacterium]
MLVLRPIAPRVLATFGALATLSCSGVLGIDDEQADAADAVCQCRPEALSDFNQCTDLVSGRLQIATPNKRSAWLESFDEYCSSGCSGDTCFNQLYYMPPACTADGETCELDGCEDCCATPTPGKICGGAP